MNLIQTAMVVPLLSACALAQGAALWTLNPSDFQDIPGLEVVGR